MPYAAPPSQISSPATAAGPMSHPNGLSYRAQRSAGEPIANLLMAKTLAHPELVSLAAGFVDQQTLPAEPTHQALEHIWTSGDRARAALQYGTTIGFAPLREAILQRMLRADGRSAGELNLATDQIVITAGSNQLLYHVGQCLLDPGDIVICGAPSYFVFLGTLENLQARAFGVEIDADGLIPRAVEELLEQLDRGGQLSRVKVIYVTPYYDNPSGVSVPAGRRGELVEIARRWSRDHRIYLIEDTAYRELRYYGDDIPSIRSFDPEGNTVVVAGTFSKSFSPGIRVGWGILPPPLVEPVLTQKGHFDFGSPHLNQVLMQAILELGLFDPHVETLRASYRAKIDAILEAADEFLGGIEGVKWVRPTGGLYVWLELPDDVDTGLQGRLFETAVEEGVLYVPGCYCYPPHGRPARKNMIRLSFGIQSCESIRKGVRALGRAIGQVANN